MSSSQALNIIDIEASGFGNANYPIEIGILLNDGTAYSSLIKPMPEWTQWDSYAEQAHGLSREELRLNGKDVQQVCSELNALCAGKRLYSDGWSHDSRWLSILFAAANTPMRFQCSAMEMVLSQDDVALWPQHKRNTALFLELEPHRALNDAIIIQSTMERLLERDTGVNSLPSADSVDSVASTLISGWS